MLPAPSYLLLQKTTLLEQNQRYCVLSKFSDVQVFLAENLPARL
jgi:hypothetical protein